MDTTAKVVVIEKFGSKTEFLRIPGADLGSWPLISEYAYETSIAAITAIAVILGICRTILRFQHHRRLDFDDGIFILAVLCTVASSAFNIYCMDFFYVETQIASGALVTADKLAVLPNTIRYLQVLYGVTALQWISIFGVKICYLVFFRKLTRRVPGIRTWWWVVLGVTIPAFILNATFGPYICSDLGPNLFAKCPLTAMTQRSMVFNQVTASMDILTDVLIITIPILLISRVRINLQRKLAVVSILTLSSAMVAVSLIRLFPPQESPNVVDTVWYVYWISFEAAIAIIMVSITGFRGIFGSGDSTRGSSGRYMPSCIMEKFSSVSSRMGRFFVWTTKSSDSAVQISDESAVSGNKREKKRSSIESKEIRNSRFFFRWTARDDEAPLDTIKSSEADEITSVTKLRPLPSKALRAVDRSVDTTGVSMPSTMSPLSTRNHDVSPLSSGVSMGGARKSSYFNVEERIIDLPSPDQYGSLAAREPGSPPSSNGIDGWALAARRAAQAEYEDRARAWGRSGQLSPDVRDIEKGFP